MKVLSAATSDHEAEGHFISTYKPFATDLAVNEERLQYIQQLNVQFEVQKKILPYQQVADMSLATDALKLI